MADEKEQNEAREKHESSMRRLQNLREDIKVEISNVINRYYESVPSDSIYEQEERGHIKDDLRRVQRRIDETIDAL
jgi:hypothetical protein